MFIAFFVLPFSVSAQKRTPTPYAVSVQGGYSWLSGVVGGDVQIGHVGIACGWMPTKMPITGEKLNSIGYSITVYSNYYDENSLYLSLGGASNGYRYEDSNGYGMTSPMTIIMGGFKTGTENVNIKLGGGYGWCDFGNAWTLEITLGVKLFGN